MGVTRNESRTARATTWMTRYARLLGVGVVLVAVALIGLPLAQGSSASFFSRYRGLSQNFHALQASSHAGIACDQCHVDTRGPVVRQLAQVGDFYAGLVQKRKTPLFVKYDKPVREACVACHRNDWAFDAKRISRVPHPAHQTVAGETRDCVVCHKWVAHEEVTAEKHKDMPFSGVCAAYGCHVGTKKPDECASCHHSLREGGRAWKVEHRTVVQTGGPNGCLEACHEVEQCRACHTTGKRPKVAGVRTETGLKAIEKAHVRADWKGRHGTEAIADKAKCLSCHVSDAECQACHSQRPKSHGSTATWIGNHEKPGKQQQRCLTCHKKSWCEDCHRQFKEMR